jgi:hypothetical protein
MPHLYFVLAKKQYLKSISAKQPTTYFKTNCMQLQISTQGKHNSRCIRQRLFSLFTLFFLLAAAPLGAQDILNGPHL